MTESWATWEGHVVDGLFSLERCVGQSDHSGVYLTQDTGTQDAGQTSSRAALKLISIPQSEERVLARWNVAAGLAHPHLMRLLHAGRCELGERQFLYLVMEYADQNLADLLVHRALTSEEVRELLVPTLDALDFLHRGNRVHGQLKPSNLLVVGDQLKLASDGICPIGESHGNPRIASAYAPPELLDGSTAASDIWALGITLTEALTRARPSRSPRGDEWVVPPDLPVAFADVIRQCLSVEARDRPSVQELKDWLQHGRLRPLVQAGPTGPIAAGARPAAGNPSSRRPRTAALAAAAAGVVVVSWAAVHMFSHSTDTPPAANSSPPPAPSVATPTEPAVDTTPGPTSVQQAAAALQAAPSPGGRPGDAKPSAADGAVVHQEIPKVPRGARATIRGHVKVAVRVTVDKSGKVVGETLAEPGPSRYFARLATKAARKWKFTKAENETSRHWLVHFVFSRDGTTGRAVTSDS